MEHPAAPSESPARPASARRAPFARLPCIALAWLCVCMVGADGATSRAWADSFGVAAEAYMRQDYVRSARILSALAAEGDPRAETYLGYMYAHGRGVPQDLDAAAHWMRLAAEQDTPAAQFFLGLMYDKGEGVPRDFVLAHAWLNLAAAHATPGRRDLWARIRDAVASKMTLAQLAEARRLAFEWRPEAPN